MQAEMSKQSQPVPPSVRQQLDRQKAERLLGEIKARVSHCETTLLAAEGVSDDESTGDRH
jgi:hypothetical protein